MVTVIYLLEKCQGANSTWLSRDSGKIEALLFVEQHPHTKEFLPDI